MLARQTERQRADEALVNHRLEHKAHHSTCYEYIRLLEACIAAREPAREESAA